MYAPHSQIVYDADFNDSIPLLDEDFDEFEIDNAEAGLELMSETIV